MLALIAGTGDLPAALIAQLPEKPVICALAGYTPKIHVDLTFRIEQLGTLLATLTRKGVTDVCFAGAVQRPDIDPTTIDTATEPLIARIAQAIGQGDDGALRIIIAIFQDHGLTVRAAHDIAPDLLPPQGVTTKAVPQDMHRADAQVGETCVAGLGALDQGQACIVQMGQVTAMENADGTAAMMAKCHATGDGILFKAPKPDQDRRADLPLIGPDTALQAAKAGLAGIVIEAGGVMVLDRDAVIETLDMQGMFLWVRPKGAA